jgi:dihydrodipicolinate synthase/N-acetylneuraminate lyase
MHRIGLLPNPTVRAPLAPLTEAQEDRVSKLLEGSPHVGAAARS